MFKMKEFSVILISFIGVVFATPLFLEEETLPRYVKFPDYDGNLHLIDLEEDNLVSHAFDPDTDMKYYIFNRRLQTYGEFKIYDEESLMATYFDSDKPVKFSIHGWTGNGLSENNYVIADGFLNAMDVNVICVDWKVGAAADYITAVRYVPLVGKKVGELLDWLNTLGVSFSDFHVIGHSLGGHVAGIAGRSATRGVVEYISGLDPAFPLWGNDSQRIRSTDGKYVEIIHTNGNQAGLMIPVGDTDFYPNGGLTMPGCSIIDTGCSHNRAYFYFADSLDHKGFAAMKCIDLDEIKDKTCSNVGSLHMGGASIKSGYDGVYYLETNAEKPFYKG